MLIFTGWLSYQRGDAGITFHIWNGYGILILLVFRLLWGFTGSSTAQFASWVTWPWSALRYGLDAISGRTRHYLGHNPLGGWMIITLMLIALSQGVAGLFTVDNNGLVGGPFSNLDFGDPTPIQRRMSGWHRLGFYVLLGFATIHILANLFYQFVKRDPLITGMVTGRKPSGNYADELEMKAGSMVWPRAAICLAASAAIVFGTVKAFGGKLPF